MDDATVEILIRMRKEGMDAARDVAQALGDVRTRMLEIQALNFQNAMAQALAPITGLWQGIQSLSGSLVGAIPLIGGWLTQLGAIPVIGPIIVLVLAAVTLAVTYLALAFATAAITVAAAVATMLTVTVAGFTAIGLAAMLALGPIGLLAGGVLLLADRMFTTGQTAVDPLLKFEKALGTMADTWGKVAFPMAIQLMDTFQKFIPSITSAGLQMLEWFGLQLPRIMQVASAAVGAFGDAFNRLWPMWVGFFGEVAARMPALGPMFAGAFGAGVNAVQGLMTNLLAFMDWFIKEWPKLQPIVQQVMDQAGKAVQWFAGEAKKLVDWFVANWPQIAELARNLEPVLIKVWQAFVLLVDIFGKIALSYNAAVAGLDKIRNALDGVSTAAAGAKAALSGMPGIGGLIGAALPGGGIAEGSYGAPGRGYQAGGMVPGTGPQLVMAHGGEMILNPDQLGAIIGLLASIDRKLSTGFSTRAYASRA